MSSASGGFASRSPPGLRPWAQLGDFRFPDPLVAPAPCHWLWRRPACGLVQYREQCHRGCSRSDRAAVVGPTWCVDGRWSRDNEVAMSYKRQLFTGGGGSGVNTATSVSTSSSSSPPGKDLPEFNIAILGVLGVGKSGTTSST